MVRAQDVRLVGCRRRASGPDSTCPTSRSTSRPSYAPPRGREAEDALRGDEPFIMQADGKGWLFAPTGLTDGPLPTHYEPHESPFDEPALRPARQPARRAVRARRTTPTTAPRRPRFPLRAHDLPARPSITPPAGCRATLPYLVGAAAGDVLRGLARARRRARPRARRLGDDRHRAHRDRGARDGHRPHARRCASAAASSTRSGCPTTGAPTAWRTGDSANDLFAHRRSTPNVHIQEFKAATCDVRPGRRPRGPALLDFVDGYRERAGRRRRDEPG